MSRCILVTPSALSVPLTECVHMYHSCEPPKVVVTSHSLVGDILSFPVRTRAFSVLRNFAIFRDAGQHNHDTYAHLLIWVDSSPMHTFEIVRILRCDLMSVIYIISKPTRFRYFWYQRTWLTVDADQTRNLKKRQSDSESTSQGQNSTRIPFLGSESTQHQQISHELSFVITFTMVTQARYFLFIAVSTLGGFDQKSRF